VPKKCLNTKTWLFTLALLISALSTNQSTASASTNAPASRHNLLLIGRAVQKNIRSCMERQGFQYVAEPSESLDITAPLPYSIPTLAMARRDGFGAQDLIDPNQKYSSLLSDARQRSYLLALYGGTVSTDQVTVVIPQGGVIGHSKSGCQASAERALYVNYQKWFRVSTIVGNYQAIAQSELLNSKTFERQLDSWRLCVQGKGFKWTNPNVAIFSYVHSHNHVSRSEIIAAIVVSTCASRTGLEKVASKQFEHYVSKFSNQYRKEVRVYWQMQVEAVRTADATKV
jgi:hypothetical protein